MVLLRHRINLIFILLFAFSVQSEELRVEPIVEKNVLLPLVIMEHSELLLYDIGMVIGDSKHMYVLTNCVNKSILDSGSGNKVTITKFSNVELPKTDIDNMSSENELSIYGLGNTITE